MLNRLARCGAAVALLLASSAGGSSQLALTGAGRTGPGVPTYVNSVQIPGGASGGSSPPVSMIGADFLVACTTQGVSGAVTSFGDSTGINTWVEINPTPSSGSLTVTAMFYVVNAAVSGSQTFSFAGPLSNAQVYGFSGMPGASLDQNAGNLNNSSAGTIQPSASGNLTPGENNALAIACMSADAGTSTTQSVNQSFTGLLQTNQAGGTNFEGAGAYLLQTVPVGINPTWTSSINYTTATAALGIFRP